MVECAGLPVRPILLAPHSGDVRDWVQAFPEFDVCRLSDRWFRSTSTYSELMVSPTLYESLVQHEWLLICQIDAVIVNPPRLHGEERFDYVGARWRDPLPIRYSPRRRRIIRCRPGRGLRVGNGGLSLRRVDAFIGLTRTATADLSRLVHDWPEDVLISALGPHHGVRVADPDTADRWFREETTRGIDPTSPDLGRVIGFHALHRHNPALERLILGR